MAGDKNSSLYSVILCLGRRLVMLSLAKKKELEAAEKPEFLPDEVLRPWVRNPGANEQLKLIVEDLEKMLALGSPVKEEHGASEIDRQIGEVDEDLLGDDEAPEPDFPLPSQAFMAYVQKHRAREAEAGGLSSDPAASSISISEDADVRQLMGELQQQQEAEGAGTKDLTVAMEAAREAALIEARLASVRCRPMTQQRLQAIKRERMKAKLDLEDKRSRPASSKPVALRGALRNHQRQSSGRYVRLEATEGAKKHRKRAAPVSQREEEECRGRPQSVRLLGVGPAVSDDQATSRPLSRSSLHSRPSSSCPSIASSTGSLGHRLPLGRSEQHEAKVQSRRNAWGGNPTQSWPRDNHDVGEPASPPSPRQMVVGDMLKPIEAAAATAGRASSRPQSAPLRPALVDMAFQQHELQQQQQQMREAVAANNNGNHHQCHSSAASNRDTSRASSNNNNHKESRAGSANNNINNRLEFLRQHRANIHRPPRPWSSTSSRSSGAASDGTIEVYHFETRAWSAPDTDAQHERALGQKPQPKPVRDTYKQRSQALRDNLAKYEAKVLSKADPRELRTEMKAKGLQDHVWQVFVDPTITKKELKSMMVSHTREEHSFNEHFDFAIRQQLRLFPENNVKRSQDALWAENALANHIKVFESGTWPRKPRR